MPPELPGWHFRPLQGGVMADMAVLVDLDGVLIDTRLGGVTRPEARHRHRDLLGLRCSGPRPLAG